MVENLALIRVQAAWEANKNTLDKLGYFFGGGREIRTLEGLRPTRFPSVRHRPLGDPSVNRCLLYPIITLVRTTVIGVEFNNYHASY